MGNIEFFQQDETPLIEQRVGIPITGTCRTKSNAGTLGKPANRLAFVLPVTALILLMGLCFWGGDAGAFPPGAEKAPGRFIDAHVHFHDRNPGDLDRVAAWMESMDVRRVINHPLAQSLPRNGEEREQMLANYANYKGRIDRFCIIFPDDVQTVEEAVTILTREKKEGAIGFGEHYGSKLMFDDPKNMRLYAACEKVGLPVMFHMDSGKNMDEKGLPHLENVLKAYPKCILIAHSDWWRHINEGACERLLRKYPNLYADISCSVKRSPIGRDKKMARGFFIKNADKLLFGTDSGWWSFDKEPAPEFAFIDELKLPKDVEDKICRGNMEKLFPSEKSASR